MNEKHKITCHMNSLAHMAEGKQFALTCKGCECPVVEKKNEKKLHSSFEMDASPSSAVFQVKLSAEPVPAPVEEKLYGPMDRCFWCGMMHAEHDVSRKEGEAVPRVPCGLLVSGFLLKGTEKPTAPSDWEEEIIVEVLEDYLYEAAVEGAGDDSLHLELMRGHFEKLKAFIRSVENAAILSTREVVVRELKERMPTEFSPSQLPYDEYTYEHGYNKALAEFRTLLQSLNQESHE